MMNKVILSTFLLAAALPAWVNVCAAPAERVPVYEDQSDLPTISADRVAGMGLEAETLLNLKPGRPIYQQADKEANNVNFEGHTLRYLAVQRALAGDGCHVNRVCNIVGVGSGTTNMGNLTDEDITNAADIVAVADVNLTTGPLVGIRDAKRYYAKGTKAGFCCVGIGSQALSLDVIKLMTLAFYRDGKFIAEVPVTDGQNWTGVNLSLVSVNGTSDQASMTFSAEAPDVFDEVVLMNTGGLNLTVGSGYRVKYAFVGENPQLPLTRDGKDWYGLVKDKNYVGGISTYNELYPTRQIKLADAAVSGSNLVTSYHDLVDDPKEGVTVQVGALVSAGGSCEIHMDHADGSEVAGGQVFPAGSVITFYGNSGKVLDVTLAENDYIELYTNEVSKKGTPGIVSDYVVTERIPLKTDVLKVGLIGGGSLAYSATSSMPFSGAKLSIGSGGLGIGGTTIQYITIQAPAEPQHSCDLGAEELVYIPESANEVLLSWKNDSNLAVKWSLISVPEGSNADINVDGKLFNIDRIGEYVVKLEVTGEGHEDCVSYITVKNNKMETIDEWTGHCGEALVNNSMWIDHELEGEYVLSKEIYDVEGSGSLITIDSLDGANNIIDNNLDNYATYTGGLNLAGNVRIVGVHRVRDFSLPEGSIADPIISDGKEAKRVGFVIEETTKGLNLGALEFLNIRCYLHGNRVYEHVIDEANTVSVNLIGSEEGSRVVRYSIEVPEGIPFDEFMLWKSGVLDVELSGLKIFYPFIEASNSDCSSILGCDGELLHQKATIIPQTGGGVNVGQAVTDLSHFIDDDLESAMMILNTVSLGSGVTVRVDFGKEVGREKQIGIIMDDKTYLAGVKAGGWLTVRLLKKKAEASQVAMRVDGVTNPGDTETADGKYEVVKENSTWGVADVNVAGLGDKRVLYISADRPVDALELTSANIAGVLDPQMYYGICTRGDEDGDGVPDCYDERRQFLTGVDHIESVANDLVVSTRGGHLKLSSASGSIDRVLVFTVSGEVADVLVAEGAKSVETDLPEGVYVVKAEMTDGKSRVLKVAL